MIERDWESKQQAMKMIAERDGYFCFICKKDFGKKEKPTLDHWIPLSKGGGWNMSNLRITHKQCNLWKGDRVPLPDGTIPEMPPKKSNQKRKRISRLNRPKVCDVCMSGRILLPNERCHVCGSGPEPIKFPGWAKRHTKECDHFIYHCYACVVGFQGRRNGTK
jgi:hypothetical protein